MRPVRAARWRSARGVVCGPAGGSLQVRVLAVVDPMTRRDRYLSESVKGTDRAARRQADKVMARLQAEVDGQRSTQSNVTLGYTLTSG
jgi:integrase